MCVCWSIWSIFYLQAWTEKGDRRMYIHTVNTCTPVHVHTYICMYIQMQTDNAACRISARNKINLAAIELEAKLQYLCSKAKVLNKWKFNLSMNCQAIWRWDWFMPKHMYLGNYMLSSLLVKTVLRRYIILCHITVGATTIYCHLHWITKCKPSFTERRGNLFNFGTGVPRFEVQNF